MKQTLLLGVLAAASHHVASYSSFPFQPVECASASFGPHVPGVAV